MEDDYTGGDICIDGSTDCIGNDIVYGSRTDIHLKNEASTEWSGLLTALKVLSLGKTQIKFGFSLA